MRVTENRKGGKYRIHNVQQSSVAGGVEKK